jgi:choline dehydrogenase-like flavoprotein
MVSTNPLAAKIRRRYAPGISVGLKNDSVRKDWIKGAVATQYHPIGTVAMGQATHERLQVLGMGGLRVIDASMVPLHVCANSAATVYAIAEKGSDFIKEDWNL